LLGGIADNIRQDFGPHGRGLFAIDPSQPVRIVVPDSLLFSIDDVVLVEGGLELAPSTGAPPRVAEFFATYQRTLSWSKGGRDEVMTFLELLNSLPTTVKKCLFEDFALQHLFAPFDETALMNPNGELLVCYSRADTWQRFVQYGFICEERSAYSLPIEIKLPTLRLSIGLDPSGELRDGDMFPQVTFSPGMIALSHLLLGDRKTPHMPRRIFIRLMQEVGVPDPANTFDRISHYNRKVFLKLLRIVEDQHGQAVLAMRRLTRLQLEALSFVMEGREL